MKKDFSKYYTPSSVATALIKLIEFKNHSSVVDICCGSGNLLNAAKQNNRTLQCYGVDIKDTNVTDFVFTKGDGREYAGNHLNTFDYSLANPPFGRIESKEDSYSDILFQNQYSTINSHRIEIEMLIANLTLLKENGTLLIILPSTVVNGTSSINVRKTISDHHFIQAIVDLPYNAFAPEKIKCSALIIQKKANNSQFTTLYHMNTSFKISKVQTLSVNDIKKGIWHKANDCCCLAFSINQGKISSQNFSDDGVIEVLHTSKYSTHWKPSIRLVKTLTSSEYICASDGDILISRIGASAGQKCIYHGKSKYISDCLLIIKKPSLEVTKQIMDLDLTTLVSGLSTPHITATSIYNFYNSVYDS